ncbi:MAG: ribonuclease H-like domain-containing protein [Deltaproteobacteria bacterium]|nr:ribonuclease H-like domain-containing protein [Deltaproteobacteria bacterium]
MIRRTFQLVRGVGPSREKMLWADGIARWEDFPPEGGAPALSANLDRVARERLAEARGALEARDLPTLASLIPKREHWRLFSDFEREAVYFDIETEGMSGEPTVVSLFHAEGFEVFVQGRDLDRLPEAMGRWPLWVTFNGAAFDVPVLARYFGTLPTPALHLDLCHVCRRMGWRGGLKKIEDLLGFGRPRHLRGVDGLDAVFLWRYWHAEKDIAALRLLVEYNLYDSIQLRTLAARAYNRGIEMLQVDAPSMPVFERGDMLYDVTRHLLTLGPEGNEEMALDRARRFALGGAA